MSEERNYTAEILKAHAAGDVDALAQLALDLAVQLRTARELEARVLAKRAHEADRKRLQRTTGNAKPAAPSADIRGHSGTSADKPDIPAESELFIAAWEAYPRRSGSNPRVNALKQWLARVREGVAEEEMLAGTRRYRAFCDATDKTGTEIVMQAQRFFGRSKEFSESWDIPVQPTRDLFTGPPIVDGWLSPEFDRLTAPTTR